jgi:YbbR domain-containing protein
MLRWIGTNLRTLLLAFALALAVWVSAVTAADPDETRTYPSLVAIEFIGQDPNLVTTGQLLQRVQITLRAPRSVWDKFSAGEATLRAVADMTGLGSGEHIVPVQIQISARPVRVISVSPHTLDVVLEPLVTRDMPVEVTFIGEAAIGYEVGAPVIDPASVVVSGPQSIVSKVDHIQTSLDMTNARQTIATTVSVKAVNAEGTPVSGVTLQPDSVALTLPLSQQGGYRDLAVKVLTGGKPASGYRLTSVAAFPPIVTVYSSNLSLIDSLPGYVETEPLDLSGANDNIDTNLSINLPPGVTLIGDQTVVVQVGIAPFEDSRQLSYRPVEVIGLASGLQVHLSPVTVDVILSGPAPVLNELLISDVHVQVDVTGLAPGTYQLTPTVKTIKQRVTIDSILPGTVEVIISSLTIPTP